MSDLKPCPFCGTEPKLPDGDGTQYEIWCEDCGGAVASVQICDLMTLEERASDSFKDYRYGEEFVERAKLEAIGKWNTRAPAEDVRAVREEPVAWMQFDGEGNNDFTEDLDTAERWAKNNGPKYADWLTPLYRHPQRPVVLPEIYKAAKDYISLRDKIRASGTPPHTDYWHHQLYDTDSKLRACIDEFEELNK